MLGYARLHHRRPFALRCQQQDRRAGHGYPAGDAMMSSPCAVFVLHLEQFGCHFRLPFFPFWPTCAAQTLADVQIREELLAANGAESRDELRVGQLTGNLLDLLRVLLPVIFSAAELF